ncbi:Phosphopentomutase [Caldithrix abyssi DSM 13497]|uniref:Phosphopentomutase n=2 Tax=Caldithrix abyssi TaxID=187145 RepID=H1XY63_CALAY|nr:phosphopentomutase [Caldithrix abyssi]APF17935.1 deoB phosphopentomutase [Caldithrix abyssi DSM 13497]EHO41990.1 Phosphopentomutase [Caldithrix abyssi DSM 13497]
MRRAIILIIDGVGIGELPDADQYQDRGSNTLANLARHFNGLQLPNLERLGIGKIHPIPGIQSDLKAEANYGKMAEISPGKDSTTGHWELAGLILKEPFPVYPNGFPEEILNEFTRRTGYEVLGNKPASGTEIIKELGEEHLRTGKLIVYTSADSVFQIAAHQDVVPLEKLYEICKIAREILTGKHAVARVIARPFVGKSAEDFVRTPYRKDFSIKPFSKTILQILSENGWPTVGIGKINDLYAHTGIQKTVKTKNNQEVMQAILKELNETNSGLIMANLVDFDMLWGHRNDPEGFYKGLKQFDSWLPELEKSMAREDMVIITADHGNDPTTPSTDHSREYVPLLVFGKELKQDVNLGVRETFADVQAALSEYFDVPGTGNGKSFMSQIL